MNFDNFGIYVGRLTKTPELKVNDGKVPFLTLTIAIDRPKRAGEPGKTDFPTVKVFGKDAENCSKNLVKGSLVKVVYYTATSSYEAGDKTVYTTDAIAYSGGIKFLDFKGRDKKPAEEVPQEVPRELFTAQIADEF